MASISKLSIRGVRAFSPEEHEQVVEFFFPCTIIVGANGCGKTTIIEALKFAVTGSLPPGNKSGQAFVHDPRSIGQSSVKANIKLRLTSTAGHSMVVVRSMEVTQKKTTMSFKQLDGVLRTTDAQGQRVSLSHKCTELDRTIPSMLGVSKAILDSVVFCHQEDSSWPLQEGAVLKKRFDEIFDSARYTKALEVMRKLRLEYNGKIKDLKADLAGLASHKHAAKAYRAENDKQCALLESVEEEMANCDKELQELSQKMQGLREIAESYNAKQLVLEERTHELLREESVIEKQRSMLQEDMTQTHSASQLKTLLRDFDAQMQQKVDERTELQAEIKQLSNDMDACREEERVLSGEIARVKAQHETYQNMLKERLAKMERLAQVYAVDLVISQSQQQMSFSSTQGTTLSQQSTQGANTQDSLISVSSDDMRAFNDALDRKEKLMREQLREHREKIRSQEDDVQHALTDMLGKQKAIENEKHKLAEERIRGQKELQALSSQVPSLSRTRKSDVEETKRRAKEFSDQLQQASSDPRRNQIQVEIRNHEEEIDKLKRQIEDDQIAQKDLRHSVEAQNSISVLKEQCARDLESLEDSQKTQSSTFMRFNFEPPPKLDDGDDERGEQLVNAMQKLVESAQDKYHTLQLDLSKGREELSASQRKVSEKEALLGHNRKAMTSMRAKAGKLSESVEKVRDVLQELKSHEPEQLADVEEEYLPSVNINTIDLFDKPQELVVYLDDRLREVTEDDPTLLAKGKRKAYTSLLKQAKQRFDRGETESMECPCCRRSMDDQVLEVFREEFRQLIDSCSADSEQKYQDLKEKYQAWRQTVSGCINDVIEFNRISVETKELEAAAKEHEAVLSQERKAIDNMSEEIAQLESESNELRELVELFKRWSVDAGRISEKKELISQKQVDLSISMTGIGDRDLKSVERDLNERIARKDELGNKINRLNKEVTSINNRISQLTQQSISMGKLSREKEAKFAKEQEVFERKAALNARKEEIEKEEKELSEQLPPILKKIRAKETEKRQIRELGKEEEDSLNSTLNQFTSDVKNFRDLLDRIEQNAKSTKKDNLSRLEAKVASTAERLEVRKSELQSLEPKLKAVVSSLDDQERHKKTLSDNLDLLDAGKRVEKLKQEIRTLEEELGSMESSDQAAYQKCASRRQDLERKKARLGGRRSEIVEQIRSVKRKLKTDEYRDIDERHRIAMIKHDTTKTATADLEKFATSVDKALCKFHSIKIRDINKIIRELWSLTYKGQDISNIELVSGQDSGSRASKSYNYRVVMTKGGQGLDMRGRCSAGQRVLACIVIRLALAETFCVNCGCIALDEPTVNLDENNKKGLAIALAQIIASRASQSNFQLILITHDQDFVTMMKTSLASHTGFDMPEKYFQVRREEGHDGKFYSKISAIDWDEL